MWKTADQEQGSPLQSLEGHSNQVMSCAFSSDGTRMVSGGVDCSVRLWDVKTGQQIALVGRHPQSVMGVTFDPAGKRVASVGREGTLRLWDVENGECLHMLDQPGPYNGMSISGVTGITQAQRAALKVLGAVEK